MARMSRMSRTSGRAAYTALEGDNRRTNISMTDKTDRIFSLWDELAGFSIGEGDRALTHLLTGLCSIFKAQNALWSVALRLPSPASGDPLRGWRPRLIHLLKPLPPVSASVQEQFDRLWTPVLDISQVLAMAGDEVFRVRLLFEALPPEWFAGDHYRRHYLDVGHADSMSMRFAINEDVRVHLFLFRDIDAPRFAPGDKEPFGLALRGLKWFCRQQLLSHGLLIAQAPLTSMERRVLLEMLEGKQEKQIASGLDHSPNTTHIHVKSIYSKFGVHNRAALTSLWLGRLPEAGSAAVR
jgi:DNA-binding CsgD family transcriptional regulator